MHSPLAKPTALVLIFLLYLVNVHSEPHSHKIHLRFTMKKNVRKLDPELYIMIFIIHLINLFYLYGFFYLFKMKTFMLEWMIKIQPLASRHLSSVLDI